jgi:TolB-like protein/Flp pilus assembly protein TadD
MSEAGEPENTGRSEPYAAAGASAVGKVFISYASQDAGAAEKVCAALEAAGLPCWIAPRDVRAGQSYAAAIVEAINSCRMLVLLLSQSAIDSPHVLREVERASSKRRPVLSVRMDAGKLPSDLEYFLSANQWLDASGRPIEQVLPALVESVRNHEGGTGDQAPGSSSPAARSASGPVSSPAPSKPSSHWKTRAIALALAVAAVGLGYILVNRLWLSKHVTAEQSTTTAANTVTDKSIAVLPFADMSEKKDQEYFADGMAEETLDLLAKVPSIRVIGRTSSFQFKGHNEDLRTIGAKLGVAYVLEGSVRKSGDRVRVTAQLVDTRDGAHIWSETYDRAVGDVLKLQGEIAVALVRALQITVGAAELDPRRSLTNVDAYDLYLRGRYALERFDKVGFDEAVSHFRQALDLDPTFADAAVALSVAYDNQANWAFVPPAVGYERAREAANAALKLDPTRALAHAVLGLIHVTYDWDWVAADRELQTALKLKPHDPFVLGAAASLQLALGHYASASQMFKEAIARDPLYATNYDLLSWAQIRLGEVAEAEASERKALEIQPGYVWGSMYLANWLLVGGEPEAALAAAQREDPTTRAGGLAVTYWALGRKAEADAALKKLIVQQADSNAYVVAWAYAYRGDRDQAFKWLERAYAQKDPCLFSIKGEPLLASLEADPRYKAFLRKMNLPE